MRKLIIFFFSVFLFSGTVYAQRSISKSSETSIVISQTINGLSNPSSTMSATIGPVIFLNGDTVTSTRIAQQESSLNQYIAPLSYAVYPAGTTQSEIISQATTTLGLQIPLLTQELVAYAKLKGAGIISLNFDQEIALPGISNTVRLFWTFTLVDGKPTYGAPIIVNSNPYLLYAIYFSKNVMSGLPPQFANASGGVLQYQLIKTDGTPISAMTSIDAGGIFDAPQPSTSGVGVDPDAGLKCLINPASTTGCVASNISIVNLMNQTSAASAILDYVRMIAPIYKTVSNSDGTSSQIAQMSLNVVARKLTVNTCHYSYENQGNYAYDLATTVDRYYVQNDGVYSRINQYTGQTWSPTTTYDYTTSVLASEVSNLSEKIIDPTGLTNNLIDISDIAILTQLAPITDVGNFDPTMGVWTSQCLVYRAWVQFRAVCDASTGNLVLQTQMDCNPGPTPTLSVELLNQNSWYRIQMSQVSGDNAPHCGGGAPWSALIDSSNNLWINFNGCGGSGDTGQNITLNSYGYLFNMGQYTATTSQSCTLFDDYGNPYTGTCQSTELFQTNFQGINLNNGQPITSTQDLGPYVDPNANSGGGDGG